MDDANGEVVAKGFVFPCPRKEKIQPIDSHALPVAVRRNLETVGISQWTPHDLRRTAATFMAGMGFMDEVIDAVLNHVKQGIIRTYNRHKYDNEKQMALEAWERKLKAVVFEGAEEKVVPLLRIAVGQ